MPGLVLLILLRACNSNDCVGQVCAQTQALLAPFILQRLKAEARLCFETVLLAPALHNHVRQQHPASHEVLGQSLPPRKEALRQCRDCAASVFDRAADCGCSGLWVGFRSAVGVQVTVVVPLSAWQESAFGTEESPASAGRQQ